MKPYHTLIRDIRGMNETTNLDSTRQVSVSKDFIIYTRATVLFSHELVLVKLRKICFSDLELSCLAPRRREKCKHSAHIKTVTQGIEKDFRR